MTLTTNKNFFSPLQAEFHVLRLPNVKFFCQRVQVPGMKLASVAQPTPFSEVRLPGDHILFNELQVTFKVDEMMTNYREVSNWMIRNGFPETYEQYNYKPDSVWSGDGPTSDGSVIFLDSKANPRLELTVKDLLPVALSDITVDTTATDVNYLTATASFAYTLYTISDVVVTE